VRRRVLILGFYISAALVNAAIAIQYALGGVFGKIVLGLLVMHFIIQILYGYHEHTVSKKYGIGLGILALAGVVVADFFASVVVRSFIKLYLVYVSLSRKHLDHTAIWPTKWYVISAVTIVLIFGSAIFKLLHWFGAVQMVMVGYGVRSIFFIYIGYFKAFTSVEVADEVAEIGQE